MNFHVPWEAFIIIVIIFTQGQTKFWIVFMNTITHFIALQLNFASLGKKKRLVTYRWKYLEWRSILWTGDATVTAQLTAVHYRRSLLVQGGLEIPCKITVTISGTVSNLLCKKKYKNIVTGRYIEPKNEEIMGSFIQAINDAPKCSQYHLQKRWKQKRRKLTMQDKKT